MDATALSVCLAELARFLAIAARMTIGEVAKRSNAPDCKSVALAASEVRILPSPALPPSPCRLGRTSRGRAAEPPLSGGYFGLTGKALDEL